MKDRKIVLLIDAENTSARYAKRIVDYLEKKGDIICARIYGDFINNASVKRWNHVAIEYEMEQKQQLTTSAGKNSSDIALVIDAMDLIYQKNIDILCIVTSDGDFTGLVKRIREDGIAVIGIGKADASKRLEKVCDQYLDFDEIIEQTEQNGHQKKKESLPLQPGNEKSVRANKKKISEKKKNFDEKKKTIEKKNADEKKNFVEKKKPVVKQNTEKQTIDKQKTNAIKKDKKNKSDSSPQIKKVGTRKDVWHEPKKESPKAIQKEKLGEIKTILHELVQQEEKNGKHAELGGVKSTLQIKYPNFSEKEFGYKTIRELIDKETKFKVVIEGHHSYVIPKKSNNDKKDGTQNGKKEREPGVAKSVKPERSGKKKEEVADPKSVQADTIRVKNNFSFFGFSARKKEK